MTRISKYRLSDKVYEKLIVLLFEVVAKRNNIEQFNKVIFELLSPTERIMIAKRVVIIFLLMKKIDYLTICNVVKVSSTTVSKFSFIMEKSEGIVPALKNIVRNEKVLLFLEGLFNDLYQPGVRGTDWKQAWKNKLDYQRKKSQGI